MSPDIYDHEIQQGNDNPLIVRISTPNGFDGSGSEWILTARFKGGSLVRRLSFGELSISIAPHPTTGLTATTITWGCPPEDSRVLPIGRLTKYELERQVPSGEQRTYLEGYMIVRRGNNVD
jgi:hypothetical protein